MDQLERPQYYEGEYLSADDLAAIVRHARVARARHELGAHVWGIGLGLTLAERPLSDGDVEMVLTPGVAWDGHARPIVALAPQRLSLDLFANFQDDTAPAGIPVEIWLSYRELPSRPPGVGFACPDDALYGRIVETFRVEVRRLPVVLPAPVEPHSVSIAGRPVAPVDALKMFDPAKPPLYDESVPHQAFPETGDAERWPVFVGIVRWRKDVGQPGRLIARVAGDINDQRSRRRYLGTVAETILAPDGVIRLRDRAKDPADADLNFRSPTIVQPDPAHPIVNDLVWCEGHLRVAGDARLQDGKLDYRVKGGGDAGVPIYLRRRAENLPIRKTTLDAFVGQRAPVPAPIDAETRFAVSTGNPDAPTELLTVQVMQQRVGINTPNPTNSLQVEGDTGIRYKFGHVTGDGAWTAVTFNAFTPPGGPWSFADAGRRAAVLMIDGAPGAPDLKYQTNTAPAAQAWTTHVVVKGATGNVGIATAAPQARLEVTGAAVQAGTAVFTPPPAKGPHASRVHADPTGDWYVRSADPAGKVVVQDTGGNTGIGAVAPRAKLEVAGAADLWGTAAFVSTKGARISHVHWGNNGEWYIRAANVNGNVIIQDNGGNVGIGTNAPVERLHVEGARIRLGTAAKRIELRTDGSAVDLHTQTHHLYIRTQGDAAHPGKRHVFINPDNATEGNVGIGTTAPSYKLDVSGDLHITGDAYKDSLGIWWLPSDLALKKDVEPIPGSLAQLLALRGVSFAWRDPVRVGAGPGRYLGFIAQDVEKVFPDWVKTTPGGTKAINPVGLEALLVEAIRELAERCSRLEAEVRELRARRPAPVDAGAPRRRRTAPKKKA